jgi:hypothetical protein
VCAGVFGLLRHRLLYSSMHLRVCARISFCIHASPTLTLTAVCVVAYLAAAEDGSNFVSFFPSFLWVLRDFNLDLEDDVRAMTCLLCSLIASVTCCDACCSCHAG